MNSKKLFDEFGFSPDEGHNYLLNQYHKSQNHLLATMKLTQHTAKHLRDIHFGGNWSTVNFKDVLSDVTWTEATAQYDDFNSIAVLTFHSTYYVRALRDVLEGNPLNAKDEWSFLCPEITSEEDWIRMQEIAWDNAKKGAILIEKLSVEAMEDDFTDEKYGSYFRNIHGIIEHLHYHLGQIVILKRIIRKSLSV